MICERLKQDIKGFTQPQHVAGFTPPTLQAGFTPPQSVAGFTLVETLVAITILLLVIIGPMTAAQKGIQQSYFSNEQIVATFLAQEPIEAMREFRDMWALGVLSPTGPDDSAEWILEVSDCESGPCRYDKNENSFVPCTESQCAVGIVGGEYVQNGNGGGTGYKRTIEITRNIDNNLEVVSTVSWTSGVFGNERRVVVQSWIYDQYRRYEP